VDARELPETPDDSPSAFLTEVKRSAMLKPITGLGDSAFLIPASALLLASCLYIRSSRAALILDLDAGPPRWSHHRFENRFPCLRRRDCCVPWFAFRYLPCPPVAIPSKPLAVALLALAILTHGRHIDLEAMIGDIARFFRTIVSDCA
jgi:hypothetical protein